MDVKYGKGNLDVFTMQKLDANTLVICAPLLLKNNTDMTAECKRCGLLKSTIEATGKLCVGLSTTNIPPHDFGNHVTPEVLEKVDAQIGRAVERLGQEEHGWDKDGAFYQCSDGKHPSWWISLRKTPQWEAWYKHACENNLYDVDESVECGWMSEEHAKDFMDFVQQNPKVGMLRQWLNERTYGEPLITDEDLLTFIRISK